MLEQKPYEWSILVCHRLSGNMQTLYFYDRLCATEAVARMWECKNNSDDSNVYFATGPYPLTRKAYEKFHEL